MDYNLGGSSDGIPTERTMEEQGSGLEEQPNSNGGDFGESPRASSDNEGIPDCHGGVHGADHSARGRSAVELVTARGGE